MLDDTLGLPAETSSVSANFHGFIYQFCSHIKTRHLVVNVIDSIFISVKFKIWENTKSFIKRV